MTKRRTPFIKWMKNADHKSTSEKSTHPFRKCGHDLLLLSWKNEMDLKHQSVGWRDATLSFAYILSNKVSNPLPWNGLKKRIPTYQKVSTRTQHTHAHTQKCQKLTSSGSTGQIRSIGRAAGVCTRRPSFGCRPTGGECRSTFGARCWCQWRWILFQTDKRWLVEKKEHIL